MNKARPSIVAAIVAALGTAGPAAGQQPAGAACGDVLATLPLLGSAMQAVTEESLRSQIARFTLPPGVSGTDIFACLCGRDSARDFFAVVEDMGAAGPDDVAACVESLTQETRGAVVAVSPRPEAGDRLSDQPVPEDTESDDRRPADRWDAYSDADLRALMQLDPALLAASLGASPADLRAELGRRLVARWHASGADAGLSDADLGFMLEDVHAGTASPAMLDVLAREIERGRVRQPLAVVRGRLEGGVDPTIESALSASSHFDEWSDAALVGLASFDADDVEALVGTPRRAAVEALARRLLDRTPTAMPVADPAAEGGRAAGGSAAVEVVHGAPRRVAPPSAASPLVRNDVDDGASQRDQGAFGQLTDCLDALAPAELATRLRRDPDSVVRICMEPR